MAAQSSIPLPPSIEAVMEVNALAGSLRHVLPAFVSRFEDLYTAWKNTRICCSLQLGPAAIPLIVQKLTFADELDALQLYNDLETDPETDPKLEVDLENESDSRQRQANPIVDFNRSRNIKFKALAAAWEDHQNSSEVMFSANSWVYASGEAYEELREMGPSIIGNIMREYAFDEESQSGWWYRMLHALVVPERRYYQSVSKKNQYEGWKNWLEEGAKPDSVPVHL